MRYLLACLLLVGCYSTVTTIPVESTADSEQQKAKPADDGPWCGNGVCEPGEMPICLADCHSVCGDHVCATDENQVTCPDDCP